MGKKKQTGLTRRQRAAKARTTSARRGVAVKDRAGKPLTSPAPPSVGGWFGAFSPPVWLMGLALGLLVLISFFPALQGGFVWDDEIFAEELLIRKASGLLNIWFSPADIKKEGHYWPLVYTSFWLEHKLWGMQPFGYHLVNVLLHLANSLLLWRLLLRLAAPGAWFIAAVFAVHPVHVESVAWVIERKDVLSALFYLTSVLTWIRYVEAPRRGRYALALLLFVAGLLSKSVVVTLPVALLIWCWWRRGRVTSTDLYGLAPFFLAAFCITAADLSFYATREELSLGYSLIERVLIAARALWFYTGKLLWPADLAVVYPLWEIRAGDPLGWCYVLAAFALAALLWYGRRWFGRGPLAGALFFAVTLAPVLGFVDYGYMQFSLVADRYQYLASIGVLGVLIGATAHGVGKLPAAFRAGAGVPAVAVLVLFGALTWRQAGIYRDEISFYSHIVSLNPLALDAYLNLSIALEKAGRREEALAASRIAVAQRPDGATTHAHLGLVLQRLGRFEEAEKAFQHALELDPIHTNTLQNMAEQHRKLGRYEVALNSYRAVLKVDQNLPNTYLGMGDTLIHLRRYDEAIAALETAESILLPNSPWAVQLQILTGKALQGLNKLDAAAERFEYALELDPDNSTALDYLGLLRFGQKRYREALDLYRKLIEINPGNPSAHSNLGASYFYLNRPTDALHSFQQALLLDPGLETARTGIEQLRQLPPQGDE